MALSPSFLIRAAAAAAVAAGAIFVGVQVNHPHVDVVSITTTELAIRNSLKVLMAVLALAGISGLYLTQVRRNGVLGFIGYLVLGTGYLLILTTTFVSAYVLPAVAGTDPSYVSDVLVAATGGTAAGDIGALAILFKVQNLCYLAGGLIFGVALYRARVLARWATALLAVGGLVTIALSVMPDAFYRLLAFPNGFAMIGLGYSLWRHQRRGADQSVATAEARPQPAAV